MHRHQLISSLRLNRSQRFYASLPSLSMERKFFLSPSFVAALQSQLPNLEINTNIYHLERHGRGESYHPTAPPCAILYPKSTLDVSKILPLCKDYNIPVIPFGAGTSVEGHVCAIDSSRPSISLDMTGMNDIESFQDTNGSMNSGDFFVTVGAGVTRLTLNEALRHTGLQFMVDPGADATIGGMVACGASGTTAVKYGTMKENVLALECVLTDGTIARCGTKSLKSSAGYNLTSLLTGSEGTLAVITRVTVKLHPIPDHVAAAICSFQSIHDAAEAVVAIRTMGIPIQRCELLDSSSIAAFNQYTKSSSSGGVSDQSFNRLEEKPTLFLEFTGPSSSSIQEQVTLAQSICIDDHGGNNFLFTDHEDERRSLWAARHKLYYASLALRQGSTTALLTDACVPLSKFADLITSTVEDVAKYGVVGPCFGHAGDGNFHCILPFTDQDTEEYRQKLHLINERLIDRTIDAGGTCTGEHGVGWGKIKYLQRQYGDGGLMMMKKIKMALDPENIMNPGKIVVL